jgi:hypothetical protein
MKTALFLVICLLGVTFTQAANPRAEASARFMELKQKIQDKAKAAPSTSSFINGHIGASKAVLPQDLQCVMCQYFVQRTAAILLSAGHMNPIHPYHGTHVIGASATGMGMMGGLGMMPGMMGGSFMGGMSGMGMMGGMMGGMGMNAVPHMAMAGMGFMGLETDSKAKQAPPAAAPAKASGSAASKPEPDFSSGRERYQHVIASGPNSARLSPLPNPANLMLHTMYRGTGNWAFQALQALCATRVPGRFMPACKIVLQEFHSVQQSLAYNDRPDVICLRIGACSQKSYVTTQPHAMKVRTSKEAKAVSGEDKKPAAAAAAPAAK